MTFALKTILTLFSKNLENQKIPLSKNSYPTIFNLVQIPQIVHHPRQHAVRVLTQRAQRGCKVLAAHIQMYNVGCIGQGCWRIRQSCAGCSLLHKFRQQQWTLIFASFHKIIQRHYDEKNFASSVLYEGIYFEEEAR